MMSSYRYYMWKGQEVKYLFGFFGISVVRENYGWELRRLIVWTKDLKSNKDYRDALHRAGVEVGLMIERELS